MLSEMRTTLIECTQDGCMVMNTKCGLLSLLTLRRFPAMPKWNFQEQAEPEVAGAESCGSSAACKKQAEATRECSPRLGSIWSGANAALKQNSPAASSGGWLTTALLRHTPKVGKRHQPLPACVAASRAAARRTAAACSGRCACSMGSSFVISIDTPAHPPVMRSAEQGPLSAAALQGNWLLHTQAYQACKRALKNSCVVPYFVSC